jgi:hypothetical protein
LLVPTQCASDVVAAAGCDEGRFAFLAFAHKCIGHCLFQCTTLIEKIASVLCPSLSACLWRMSLFFAISARDFQTSWFPANKAPFSRVMIDLFCVIAEWALLQTQVHLLDIFLKLTV